MQKRIMYILFLLIFSKIIFGSLPIKMTFSDSNEDNAIFDGKSLFFISNRNGNNEIFQKNIYTNHIYKLSNLLLDCNDFEIGKRAYQKGKFSGELLIKSWSGDVLGNYFYLQGSKRGKSLVEKAGADYNLEMKENFYAYLHKDPYFDRQFMAVSNFEKTKYLPVPINVTAFCSIDSLNYLFLINEKDNDVIISGNFNNNDNLVFNDTLAIFSKIHSFCYAKDPSCLIISARNYYQDSLRLYCKPLSHYLQKKYETSNFFVLTEDKKKATNPYIYQNHIYYTSLDNGNSDIWKTDLNGLISFKSTLIKQWQHSLELKDSLRIKKNLKKNIIYEEQKYAFSLERVFELATIKKSQFYQDQALLGLINFYKETNDSLKFAFWQSKAEAIFRKLDCYGIFWQKYGKFLREDSIQISYDCQNNELTKRLIHIVLERLWEKKDIKSLSILIQKYQEQELNERSYAIMSHYFFVTGNYQKANYFLRKAIVKNKDPLYAIRLLKIYINRSNLPLPETYNKQSQLLLVKAYAIQQYLLENIRNRYGLEDKLFNLVSTNPENNILLVIYLKWLLKKAEVFISENNILGARSVYQLIISRYANFDKGLYKSIATKKLGKIYEDLGDQLRSSKQYNKACEYYLKIISHGLYSYKIFKKVINCYNNIGQLAEALNMDYKNYPQKYGSYAKGYIYSLMATQSRVDNADKEKIFKSISFLRQSLGYDPGNSYAYLTLSFNYIALYKLDLLEKEKQTFLGKSINYILGPLKYIYYTVFPKDIQMQDYLALSIQSGQKNLSIIDKNDNPDLYYKCILNIANSYYYMGEYGREKSLHYYLKLDKHHFSSSLQKAYFYERRGHCKFTVGDNPLDDYQKANKLFRINKRNSSIIRIKLREATYYLSVLDKEGDYTEGFHAYKKYIEVLSALKSEIKDDVNLSLIERNLAYSAHLDQEYKKSASYLKVLIKNYENRGDGFSWLDKNYITISIFGLSIPVYQLQIKIGKSNSKGFDNHTELFLLYSLQSENYKHLVNYKKAREMVIKKLELAKKIDNKLLIGFCENRLGMLSYLLGDYKIAKNAYQNAFNIFRLQKIEKAAIVNYNSFLRISLLLNDLPETILFNTSWSNYKENFANYHNLCGAIYFQKANNLSQRTIFYSYNLSKLYLIAEHHWKKALTILENFSLKTHFYEDLYSAVLHNLINLYDNLNDKKRYNIYMEKITKTNFSKKYAWRLSLLKGKFLDQKTKLFQLKKSEKEFRRDMKILNSPNAFDEINRYYNHFFTLKKSTLSAEEYLKYHDNQIVKFQNSIFFNKKLKFKKQIHQVYFDNIKNDFSEISRYRKLSDRALRDKDSLGFFEYSNKSKSFSLDLDRELNKIKSQEKESFLNLITDSKYSPTRVMKNLDSAEVIIDIYDRGNEFIVNSITRDSIFQVSIGEKMDLGLVSKILGHYNKKYLIMSSHVWQQKEKLREFYLLGSMRQLESCKSNLNINIGERISSDSLSFNGLQNSLLEGIVNLSCKNKNSESFYFNLTDTLLNSFDLLQYSINNQGVEIDSLPNTYRQFLEMVSILNYCGAYQVTFGKKYKLHFGIPSLESSQQTSFARNNFKKQLSNGLRYYKSRRYYTALIFLKNALFQARKLGKNTSIKKIRKIIATCYMKLSDHAKAIEQYQEIERQFDEDMSYSKATIYYQWRKYKSCQILLKNMLKTEISSNKLLKIWNLLSIVSNSLQDYKMAIKFRKKYLVGRKFIINNKLVSPDIFTKDTQKEYFVSVLNLVTLLFNNEKYKEVIFYIEMLEKYYSFWTNVQVKYEKVKLIQGRAYFATFQFNKAISALQSLDVKSEYYHQSLQYLSDIYYRMGDYKKSDKILERIEDTEDIWLLQKLNTKALIKQKQDHYQDALYLFRQAFQIAYKGNNIENMSVIKLNMANIEIDNRNFKKASEDLWDAIRFYPHKNLSLPLLYTKEIFNYKVHKKISKDRIDSIAEIAKSNNNYLYQMRLKFLKIRTTKNIKLIHDLYQEARSIAFSNNQVKEFFGEFWDLLNDYGDHISEELVSEFYDFLYLYYRYNINFILPIKLLEKIYNEGLNFYSKRKNYQQIYLLLFQKQHFRVLSHFKTYKFITDYIILKKINIVAKYIQQLAIDKSFKSYLLNEKETEIKLLLKDKEYLLNLFFPKMKEAPFDQKDDYLRCFFYGNHNDVWRLDSFNGKVNIQKICSLSKVLGMHEEFLNLTYLNLNYEDKLKNNTNTLFKNLKFWSKNFVFYADSYTGLYNFPFSALIYNGKYLLLQATIGFWNFYKLTDILFQDNFSFKNLSHHNKDALFFAEKEQQSLESKFKDILFKSKESEFKSNINPKLLHIPVHCLYDSLKQESYFLLTSEEEEDGKLYFSEIIKEAVEVKELLIPACSTSGNYSYLVGKDISLSFLINGSHCVLSSTWDVLDQYTAVIMKRYFRYRKQGLSAALSLKKSQEDFVRYYNKNPYFWAGMKLITNQKFYNN